MAAARQVSSRSLKKEEYEAQFFGFSSRYLSVHMKNTVKEICEAAATDLQKILVEKKMLDENEVKCATSSLIKNCDVAIERHTKDLESCCYSYFKIPDKVLLPEDSVQCVQFSSEESEILDRELISLKMRLFRARAMKNHMTEELEHFEGMKSVITDMQSVKILASNHVLENQNKQIIKLKKLVKVVDSINSCITSETRTDDHSPFMHILLEDKNLCSTSE